jgi:hypothetical protein
MAVSRFSAGASGHTWDDRSSVNCLVETGLHFAADHVSGDLQNFDPLKFVAAFDSLKEYDVSLVCGLSLCVTCTAFYEYRKLQIVL